MADDIWHYPRTAFTHDIFVALTQGPGAALSLFGPRRTGKTQFLLYDLGAHAEGKYRHKVVYASFWASPSPLNALLYALHEALSPKTLAQRAGKFIGGAMPSKVRLEGPKGTAIELDLTNTDASAEDFTTRLTLLDHYLGRLANPKRPTLLLLDEFQEIAAAPDAKDLMAALRTGLDTRKDGLRSLFTGSSQNRLQQIFSAREAPFFRFATPISLPDLTEDFVVHQLDVFAKTFHRKLDPEIAQSFFARFGGNPMIFRTWLVTLGTQRHLSEQEAMTQAEASLAATLDFDRIWITDLKATHRIWARLIAERTSQITGQAGADRYEALTGKPAPTPQSRQSLIRKLERDGLVDNFDGERRIADPLFERFVLDRDAAEFT